MVKIYTTPTCPYCLMTKNFLKKKKVAFEELNVFEDKKFLEEMEKKSHQTGVPVIDIEGEIVVGFNRKEIERLLGENPKH